MFLRLSSSYVLLKIDLLFSVFIMHKRGKNAILNVKAYFKTNSRIGSNINTPVHTCRYMHRERIQILIHKNAHV